jgi:nucleolar protein 4
MDAGTSRSRGTGFVCFWNRADAETVVEESNIIRADMTGAVDAPLVRSCYDFAPRYDLIT